MMGCAMPEMAMARIASAETPHSENACPDQPGKTKAGHAGAMTCVGCAALPDVPRAGRVPLPADALLFRPSLASLSGRVTAPDPPPPRAG